MSAYLQITLKIKNENREAAAAVYMKYKKPFLDKIAGAKSKELLIRDEDVQVMNGGDVLRSLSKKKMYGSPNSNPSPELGADKENHTSWERYYQVSDCSSSLRNDWYSGI